MLYGDYSIQKFMAYKTIYSLIFVQANKLICYGVELSPANAFKVQQHPYKTCLNLFIILIMNCLIFNLTVNFMKQSEFTSQNIQNNQRVGKCQQNSLYKYIKEIGNRSFSSKNIKSNQNQFAFKPSISQLPFHIYPDKSQKTQLSKQSITQRLIQNKIKKEEVLKMIKIQEDQIKFQKNCTFKPQISYNTTKILKDKFKTEGYQNVYNRLYTHALQQKLFQNVNNSQAPIQFTFKPIINPISLAILNQERRNLDPIYKRLDEILKEKRQKRKYLQQIDKNKQRQNLFTVNNLRTKQIIQSKKQLKQQVLNRLFNFNQRKKDNLQKAVKAQKNKVQQLCPFKPTISPNSFNLNEHEFLQRQQVFQQRSKQNMINMLNQEKNIFKPQINRISQILTREKRQSQTLQDKCNRLHYQTVEKQEKLQEITLQLYKQCTFQPKINQISKAIDCVPKIHKCKCQKKQQQFQFRPKICQKSRQIGKNKNVYKVTKQQQIQKIKMEKQYKQLVECTFKPQTNKQLKKHTLSQALFSSVRGAKEYMSKINQIRQKKLEQQNYKKKIFNLEQKYRPKSYTKVEQFNLSEVDRYKKRQRLIREMELKQQQQCTFQPVIHSLRS